MPTARPRIIYFDIRGRAEAIRLMFEDLGEAYDDERVRSSEAWAALKPHTPFGSLPIYREGDLEFAQTQAIYRHIARTRDLYGTNEREYVECDVGAEALSEAIDNLWRFFWEPDYAEKTDVFERGALAEALLDLERWLTRTTKTPQFWIDDRLTYVDFVAWCYLDSVDAFFPAAVAARPALAAFHRAFQTRPRIAAYLASNRRPRAFGIVIDGIKWDPRMKSAARK